MQSSHSQPIADSIEHLLDAVMIHTPQAVRHACYIYQYRISHDELEDICQDVIVFLIENDCYRLRTYEQKSLVKTWIYTVVKNFVRRRLRNDCGIIYFDGIELYNLICQPEQERSVILKEQLESIHMAISRLSRQAQILLKLFIRGYSDMEISRFTGVKADAVRKRRYKYLKMLKKLL